MKVLILPLILLMFSGCSLWRKAPGSYSSASVDSYQVIAAAEFAVAAQQAEMSDRAGESPVQMSLVKVLRAHHQVVAGKNYKLRLKVEVDGTVKRAEALVWYQSWRMPEPYELISWSWK